MTTFPRTEIGGVSVSRMIVGSNWFLGFTHASAAKDKLVREWMTVDRVADVLEVFLKEGVDTVMGLLQVPVFHDAVREAEQRAGRKLIVISTPGWDIRDTPEGYAAAEQVIDKQAELGATICMPHQICTDSLVRMPERRIVQMDRYCKMIRDRGMIPGLSTHMPQTIVYADESGLDVETYLSIYNAAGFLMQLEADWTYRIIWNAKKPVCTIKPLAGGRLLPLVGLAFNWSTIRDKDLVTVGVSSPDEAHEVVEISRALLDRRMVDVELQKTRSKASV